MRKTIKVKTVVKAPVAKAWDYWNTPKYIPGWAFAADDWEAYDAENDVRVGGKFKTTMAVKGKSASFEFTGVYTKVGKHEVIEYIMDDGRKVSIQFESIDGDKQTRITETFEPENKNPLEMQRSGWQAILNNFKKYAERKK